MVKVSLMAAFPILVLLCISCDAFLEDKPGQKIEHKESKLYFKLGLTLSTSPDSRSTLEDDGRLIRTRSLDSDEKEDAIEYASVFFFNLRDEQNPANNEVLLQWGPSEISIILEDDSYSLLVPIGEEELMVIAGKKMRLYVVANLDLPSTGINHESDLLNSSLNETQAFLFNKPYGAGTLPLSNEKPYLVDLSGFQASPDDETILSKLRENLFTEDTSQRLSSGKILVWNITAKNDDANYESEGELSLSRCVARIDYSSPSKNIYQLKIASEPVYLKIVSMQLFNLRKESLLFGFPNDDWSNQPTATYLNKLVAIDEEANEDLNSDNWKIEETENIAYTTTESLGDWLRENGKVDSDAAPWHYVMENVIPDTQTFSCDNATGIEFNAVVCDKDGSPLTKTGDEPFRICLGEEAGELKGFYKDVEYRPDARNDDNHNMSEPPGYYIKYRYLLEDTEDKTDEELNYSIRRNTVYEISLKEIASLPGAVKPSGGEPSGIYLIGDFNDLDYEDLDEYQFYKIEENRWETNYVELNYPKDYNNRFYVMVRFKVTNELYGRDSNAYISINVPYTLKKVSSTTSSNVLISNYEFKGKAILTKNGTTYTLLLQSSK